MRPAAGFSLQDFGRIAGPGVDDQIGAHALGVRQLGVVDIDTTDHQAHGLGVLDRQVSQAAAAGDGHPLAGLRLGLLDALVGSDPRADQGRGLFGAEALGNVRDVVGVGQDVLGEAAIPGVAAELGLSANGLPRGQAVFAVTAGRVEPGHADSVALLDDGHPGAQCDNDADRLVTGNEGRGRLQRPVAVRGMQVGVADAARFGLHQNLAWSGRWDIPFLEHQRLSDRGDDRGLHLVGHLGPLLGTRFRRNRLDTDQAAAAPRPLTASIILMSTAWASPKTMLQFGS